MSRGGLWGAYTRLPKETRLRLGVAGILFSVLGIVATPGAAHAAQRTRRTRVRACPLFGQCISRVILAALHYYCYCAAHVRVLTRAGVRTHA